MNRIASIAVALSVFFIGAFALVNAQTKGSPSEAVTAITQLENKMVKAFLGNPRQFIQNNYVDDYVEGSSFGKWDTKAEMLKSTENAANRTNSMTIHDLKVQAYGDVGIARYSEKYDEMHAGEHRARTIICTDIWMKQNGAWKSLASHCSQTQ
jgi:ketosteroid isomerase-like protein